MNFLVNAVNICGKYSCMSRKMKDNLNINFENRNISAASIGVDFKEGKRRLHEREIRCRGIAFFSPHLMSCFGKPTCTVAFVVGLFDWSALVATFSRQ